MFVKTLSLVACAAGGLAATSSGPVVFEPSGQWHGDEGKWSTFAVHIGSPSQTVYLLPDPHRHSLVVIGSEACQDAIQVAHCEKHRGNVFRQGQSKSWQSTESRLWDMDERMIKPEFGVVQPIHSIDESMPRLNHSGRQMAKNHFGTDLIGGKSTKRDWNHPFQGIISVATNNPFIGLLGIASNKDPNAAHPSSYFDNVREASGMKGASWSYTAGSRASNIPGSLIFGGYDKTRMDPKSTLTFPMDSQNRMHGIEITGMTIKGGKDGDRDIKESGPAEINFAQNYLHLPHHICERIKDALGLEYDNINGRFTISHERHEDLNKKKASISLNLRSASKSQTFTIPYHDLAFENVRIGNKTERVFGIRGTEDTVVLGRAFMQQAHMIAVFDHPDGPYINVSQARYEHGKSQVVEIKQSGNLQRKHKGLSAGAIAGIVIGVIAFIGLQAYLCLAFWTRRPPFKKAKRDRPESGIQLRSNMPPTPPPAAAAADELPPSLVARKSVDDLPAERSAKEMLYWEADEHLPEEDAPPVYTASPLDIKR